MTVSELIATMNTDFQKMLDDRVGHKLRLQTPLRWYWQSKSANGFRHDKKALGKICEIVSGPVRDPIVNPEIPMAATMSVHNSNASASSAPIEIIKARLDGELLFLQLSARDVELVTW